MNDDNMVTELGEGWNSMIHRQASVERCENGYVVKYRTVGSDKSRSMGRETIDKRKVFITNTDMLEFLEWYFEGEPKP